MTKKRKMTFLLMSLTMALLTSCELPRIGSRFNLVGSWKGDYLGLESTLQFDTRNSGIFKFQSYEIPLVYMVDQLFGTFEAYDNYIKTRSRFLITGRFLSTNAISVEIVDNINRTVYRTRFYRQ